MFKIRSVSDGTVEKKGWLKLGGYRLGIRSDSGIYYYYAHLASYADNIKCGDRVKAGQFIGYMGNTGYGDEGTSGIIHTWDFYLCTLDINLICEIYFTLCTKNVCRNGD